MSGIHGALHIVHMCSCSTWGEYSKIGDVSTATFRSTATKTSTAKQSAHFTGTGNMPLSVVDSRASPLFLVVVNLSSLTSICSVEFERAMKGVVIRDNLMVNKAICYARRVKHSRKKRFPERRAEMKRADEIVNVLDGCTRPSEGSSFSRCPDKLKKVFESSWSLPEGAKNLVWTGGDWRPAIFRMKEGIADARDKETDCEEDGEADENDLECDDPVLCGNDGTCSVGPSGDSNELGCYGGCENEDDEDLADEDDEFCEENPGCCNDEVNTEAYGTPLQVDESLDNQYFPASAVRLEFDFDGEEENRDTTSDSGLTIDSEETRMEEIMRGWTDEGRDAFNMAIERSS